MPEMTNKEAAEILENDAESLLIKTDGMVYSKDIPEPFKKINRMTAEAFEMGANALRTLDELERWCEIMEIYHDHYDNNNAAASFAEVRDAIRGTFDYPDTGILEYLVTLYPRIKELLGERTFPPGKDGGA